MNRISSRMGLAALILAAGPVLLAQTVTTGALSGTVVNTSRQPVAGALVRATSGQITRSATSDGEGKFSFGLMNAGPWQVTVSLSGYSTVKQMVSINANATLTSTFKVAKEGGMTVEVVATNSTIDATTTTTGANFSIDTLAALPRGRDITEMAFMAPGVTAGGFGTAQTGGLGVSMNGASGAENSFSIDGLATNDMRYGGAGVSLVSDFVEQVDIQTGGYKPEYSALGGVFNVITKSGSNQFSGSAWFTDTPSFTQPGPKRSLFASEVSASSKYDMGAWVGGALIPDKLFYSLGVDFNRLTSGSTENSSGITAPGARTDTTQLFMKLNYFLSTDHQLTLSYFGTPSTTTQPSANATPANIDDGYGTDNQGNKAHNPTSNVNLIWDGILTPSMNLSVKVGQSKLTNTIDPDDPGMPLVRDSNHLESGAIFSRGGYGLVSNEENKTTQGAVDFSWVLGSHALKLGYSFMDSSYSLNEYQTGGARYTIAMRANPDIDGAPEMPYLRERVITNNATVKARFQAIYAQDTWQVTPGLNVFYGARLEDQKQFDFKGRTFLHFKFSDYIQPRLGFTWDAMGNGRSKVTGSYAIYYEKIPQRMAIREFGGEVFYENRYNTGGYAAGSDNHFAYDFNARNMIGTFGGAVSAEDGSFVDYASSFNNPPVMDGIKLPQREEIQLGYDQTLTDTITVGIHAKYRKLKNVIEDSVLTYTDEKGETQNWDSNGMAIIWNPKAHGASWMDSGTGEKVTVPDTLFPDGGNTYKAADVSFEYKTADTYLKASYLWSRLEGNYEGVVSSSNGQPDGNITASFDYWPYVGTGLLPLDRTHEIKVYGFHTFQLAGHPLHAGFNLLWQSGVPYSKWDNGAASTPPRPDIGDYGDSTPMNGVLGDQGRTPSHSKLDLNFDYEIGLGGKRTVVPMISIFNVANSRPVRSVLEQATDAGGVAFPDGKWASPTAWYAGRSVLFGVKMRF